MSDWRKRAEIFEDVVSFSYIDKNIEKRTHEIYIWDLDKTYLDTSIDGLIPLLMTAVERAFNKKNVPGTKKIMQTLGNAWKKKQGLKRFPLYFISASPPQLEARLAEKFAMDGIFPYGCFYKDNLKNLRPTKLWRLKKQVGYKVHALLYLRSKLPEDLKQVCWGDDSESDAVIYNLYSDICAKRLIGSELKEVLRYFNVNESQLSLIEQLQATIPSQDPVDKIYINLAADTDPDYYLKFGRRTLATYDSFQIAIDLFQDQRIDLEDVFVVAQDMMTSPTIAIETLNRSLTDFSKRRVIDDVTGQSLVDYFKNHQLPLQSYHPFYKIQKPVKVNDHPEYSEPWVAERIDYFHDYR